jgi:hypothetical protein
MRGFATLLNFSTLSCGFGDDVDYLAKTLQSLTIMKIFIKIFII